MHQVILPIFLQTKVMRYMQRIDEFQYEKILMDVISRKREERKGRGLGERERERVRVKSGRTRGREREEGYKAKIWRRHK